MFRFSDLLALPPIGTTPRKDSGEAHLDYLKIPMTNVAGSKTNLTAEDRQQDGGSEVNTDLILLDVTPLSYHGHEGGPGDTFADPAANHIFGNDRDNTINGTDLRDVIKGRDGDDTINGHDGNDTIFGERGDDVINGGNGNDLLSGGPGDDTIFAGDDGGLNVLNGGHGVDAMYGSEFANVTDVFQFTQDKDALPSNNPDAIDRIFDFRDGDDLIQLIFDANEFQSGHQGFQIVHEDDAGTAGTMWFDKINHGSWGVPDDLHWLDIIIRGHTDNDGTADFAIRVQTLIDGDEIDRFAEDAAYQALTADDFIFG